MHWTKLLIFAARVLYHIFKKYTLLKICKTLIFPMIHGETIVRHHPSYPSFYRSTVRYVSVFLRRRNLFLQNPYLHNEYSNQIHSSGITDGLNHLPRLAICWRVFSLGGLSIRCIHRLNMRVMRTTCTWCVTWDGLSSTKPIRVQYNRFETISHVPVY